MIRTGPPSWVWLLRLGADLSPKAGHLLRDIVLVEEDDQLILELPKDLTALEGELPERRLQPLADHLGCVPIIRNASDHVYESAG